MDLDKIKSKFKRNKDDDEEYEDIDEELEDEDLEEGAPEDSDDIEEILTDEELTGEIAPDDDITGDIDLGALEDEKTQGGLTAEIDEEDLDRTSDDLGMDLSDVPEQEQANDLTSELSEATGELSPDLSELEDEPEQATGEVVTDLLEEDLEEEDLENDDLDIETEDIEDEEDEEHLSPIQKIINEKLPFLKGLIDKFSKKSNKAESDVVDEDEVTKTQIGSVDDIEDDDEKVESALDKLKSKVPALAGLADRLKKKRTQDQDEEEDEELDPDEVSPISYSEDEEEAPKKKIKIIHVAIVLLGLYVGYDEFFATKDPEIPTADVKLKKRKKKSPPPKKKQAPAEQKKQATSKVVEKKDIPKDGPVKPEESKPLENNTQTEELSSDTNLAVEEGTMEDTTDEQAQSESKEPKDEEASIDESLDDLFEETETEKPPQETEVAKDEDSSQKGETTISDSRPDNSTKVSDNQKSLGEDASQKDDSQKSQSSTEEQSPLELLKGSLDDEVIDGSVDQELTDSILEDLEVKIQSDKKETADLKNLKPTDPPTYEINGRSLVYNCAGKHWACIDSISYKTCEDNYAWNSKQGRSIECYPVQQYPGQQDCETIQQIKIDNVAETDFCRF